MIRKPNNLPVKFPWFQKSRIVFWGLLCKDAFFNFQTSLEIERLTLEVDALRVKLSQLEERYELKRGSLDIRLQATKVEACNVQN